jgi:hypothetical protein
LRNAFSRGCQYQVSNWLDAFCYAWIGRSFELSNWFWATSTLWSKIGISEAMSHLFSWFYFQLKQYFHDSNFPEWTKTQSGITVPLTLPERPPSDFGQPRETSCLMCQDVFLIPEKEKEFLSHLVIILQ